MDRFSQDVQAYVALDDNLASNLKATKQMRAERKNLEERIAEFMTAENLDVVPAGDAKGNIRVTTKRASSALTRTVVTTAAAEFFDEETAEAFVKFLDGFRDSSEKTVIKRVKAGTSGTPKTESEENA